MGRSPLSFIEISEGAPCPCITYLAYLSLSLQHLLFTVSSNRGIAFLKKGDHDKALADFNKAIELDPNNALAYSNRGKALSKKGNDDKALADYNKAIE